ncbi:MAG TPA: hypothetical protein VM076_22200 [Gemmatimonadaceae bacterium]|nr:hypothetical protein [Gemmatimonadaceae bacterium]
MNTLRWTIGIITALLAAGWVALDVVGTGFRRSFGASDTSPLLSIVPVVVALLVIASVAWPERRLLLHVVAVVMLALAVGCVFLARETVFVATVGLAYAGLWLLFYYRAVWR